MTGRGVAGVAGEIAQHRVTVELGRKDRLVLAVAMDDRATGAWCRDAIRQALGLGPLTTVPEALDGQDGIPPRAIQVNLSDREYAALRQRADVSGQSLGLAASEAVLRRAREVVDQRGGPESLGLGSRAA